MRVTHEPTLLVFDLPPIQAKHHLYLYWRLSLPAATPVGSALAHKALGRMWAWIRPCLDELARLYPTVEVEWSEPGTMGDPWEGIAYWLHVSGPNPAEVLVFASNFVARGTAQSLRFATPEEVARLTAEARRPSDNDEVHR